jgi:AhpD family alkylhydroperoxidase
MSPKVWAGFGDLHRSAVADGALSAKVKELMALSIAVVKQCDGCIAYHAKAATRRGREPGGGRRGARCRAAHGRWYRVGVRAPSLGCLPGVRTTANGTSTGRVGLTQTMPGLEAPELRSALVADPELACEPGG